MALSADLFLQAWRPPAYVISGPINWLSMFLVGTVFRYVVVRNVLLLSLKVGYAHRDVGKVCKHSVLSTKSSC